MRQRDALLAALSSLVVKGELGLMPGMAYAELHRDELRKAARIVKRIRSQVARG